MAVIDFGKFVVRESDEMRSEPGRLGGLHVWRESAPMYVKLCLLHGALSLAAQCIVIGPVCGCVCLCV